MKNFFVVLISAVFALTIAEVFLRWDQKRKQPLETRVCRRSSSYVHHELIPSTTCRSQYQEWDTTFSVNSLGFRSPEVSVEKPEGTFRVLLLGDSFVESESVNLDQTAAQIAQRDLIAELNIPIEIVNVGVMSYSPILYKRKLQQWAKELSPDLIVIAIDMSDFQNDYSYSQDLDAGGNFRNILFQQKMGQPHVLLPVVDVGIKFWLRRHSVFYSIVADHTKRLIRMMRHIPESTVFAINDPRSDPHYATRSKENASSSLMWEEFGKNMIAMNDYLQGSKIPWIAVIYPYGHQIAPDEWEIGREKNGFKKGEVYTTVAAGLFEEFGKEYGFTVINMIPAFEQAARDTAEYLYWPYDGHFTPKGQEVFATQLKEVIRGYTPRHRS